MRKLLLLITLAFIQQLVLGQTGTYKTDSSFKDNVYWKRMQAISSTVPVHFNQQIQTDIKSILNDPRTPTVLGKYIYFQDTITKIFSQYGIPSEMQLIALANTWCKETYSNEEGETGMWPLSFQIANKYGLTINSYVDERKKVYAAAHTAAKSMADLYTIYRDWYFTIAAFRSGPVQVNKAIRMASNSLDFFEVEPFIELKNRKAFSKFMAFMYVVNHSDKHQIIPKNFYLPRQEQLCTPRTFSFVTIAQASKTSLYLLQKLNPEYKKQLVPHKPFNHCVMVPKGNVVHFKAYILKLEREEEEKRVADSLARVKRYIEKFQPDSTGYQILVLDGRLTVLDSAGKAVDPEIPIITQKPKEANSSGNRWVFYTVKSGDALLLLADVFDVSLSDVKRWNKLRGNTIRKGQRLKFLVPANKYSKYSSINRMSSSQKQRLRRKD